MEIKSLEIKTFLGFTDNIKEPRKSKVEKDLSKLHCYEDGIYNEATFVCRRLLEGYNPIKKENYQYYKRNGELSKPKTLYEYKNEKGWGYDITKTIYEFSIYLIGKGLTTTETILEYDKTEAERSEAAERARKEKEARREAEERQKEQEREQSKVLVKEECGRLPEAEKKLANDIFIALYGTECKNYSLLAEIHNFDNPYCKEEIISTLHNDNKASIKIFECITGLKLPKSYKERKAYLEGLKAADFKGVTEYNPRTNRRGAENTKEEFYISECTPNGKRWTKVLADPLTKYGIDMFIRKEAGRYTISLAESGILVVYASTKKKCLENLKAFVERKGEETFARMIQKATDETYKAIGINPRYASA